MRLYVLIFCLLLFFPAISSKPFSTRGEAREALVAQNMLLEHNWILPPAYSDQVPSKPPVLHWLSAALSLASNEVTELTARLPSALAATFFALFYFNFLQRSIGASRAWWSVVILATSVEWNRAASACRVDMLLACAIAAALILLFSWGEREYKGLPIAAIFCLSIAFLAKGPIGLALPGLIFICWSLFQGRGLVAIFVDCLKVFPLALLLPLFWYGAAYLERPEEFLQKIYYENVARLTSSMEDEPHKHSLFYLFGVLALGLLPWSIICASWVPTGLKRLRNISAWSFTEKMEHFAFLASAVITLFFCIPSSKRGVYLLPAYPFYALLIATFIEVNLQKLERVVAILTKLIACLGLLILAALGVGLVYPQSLDGLPKAFLIRSSLTFFDARDVIYLAPLALTAFVILSKRLCKIQALLSIVVALIIAINGSVTRLIADSLACKQYLLASSKLADGKQVYSYLNEFYSVSFYWKHKIISLNSRPASDGLVLLYERDLQAFRDRYTDLRVSEISRSPSSFIKPG